jgi:cell division protein FtsW (lipid II flippase)
MDALRLDPVLLSLLIILALFGSMVLYSASGSDQAIVVRQMTRIVVALMLMIAIANIPLRMIRKISIWLYLAGVGMLVAVMFFGEVGKGAQRWLDLGILRFQPSEILKLAVPMIVATYLANRVLPVGLKELVVSSVLVLIPVLLIARQPDLGTAILVGSAGLPRRVDVVDGAVTVEVCVARLSAQSHFDPAGPGKRPTRLGLPYNTIQDCNRFGRSLWQGVAKRHPVAA